MIAIFKTNPQHLLERHSADLQPCSLSRDERRTTVGSKATSLYRDVSIIVVNWNARELLYDCLRSIEGKTGPVSYEVIVVDNASEDGSPDMVRKNFDRFTLVEKKVNSGYPAACNEGMKIARGRYFHLLNSDVLFKNDVVSIFLKYMEENTQVGLIGGVLLWGDGTVQPSCGHFPHAFSPLISSSQIKQFYRILLNKPEQFPAPFLETERHFRKQEVDWIVGASLFVRRQATKESGLMDENIFLYAEELEWCYRIKKAGWKIVYQPEAEIIHFGGGSTHMAQASKIRAILNSTYYFHEKHFGVYRAGIYRFSVLVGSLIKTIFWSLFYALLPSKRSFCQERIIWDMNSIRWALKGTLSTRKM